LRFGARGPKTLAVLKGYNRPLFGRRTSVVVASRLVRRTLAYERSHLGNACSGRLQAASRPRKSEASCPIRPRCSFYLYRRAQAPHNAIPRPSLPIALRQLEDIRSVVCGACYAARALGYVSATSAVGTSEALVRLFAGDCLGRGSRRRRRPTSQAKTSVDSPTVVGGPAACALITRGVGDEPLLPRR
jgi:hypothetical protein